MTEQAPLPGKPEDAAGPESAGAQLRRMRQAAGMDVGVLAGTLKVPAHKIEALEADRLEQFPNLTFARGLAGAICRTLRTDAAPVLARMPAIVAELRERDTSIDQPFRRSEEGPAPLTASPSSRPLLIFVVVALLLGLALLALWPTQPVQSGAPEPETADAEPQDQANAPPPAPSFVQESVPVPAMPAASQAQPQEPQAPAAAPASAPASAPAPVPAPASAPAAAAAAAAPASAAAEQAGKGVLGLSVKSETWVSVRDAKDKALVNRTVRAGESLSVDGELPLVVIIGRKEAVSSITVRGKPLEVKTSGTSTVMRFTVE